MTDRETFYKTWNAGFEDEAEREQSQRLAEARQQIAHQGGSCPTWDELTDHEQEMGVLAARNYLRALTRAGYAIVPAADEAAVRVAATPASNGLSKDDDHA